jgi:hypothetical protein
MNRKNAAGKELVHVAVPVILGVFSVLQPEFECHTGSIASPGNYPVVMTQIVPRALVLLGSWAIGLLVAAWVVPGVSVSVSGFIVAVVIFSVTEAVLSLLILTLPRGYASLFLGGTALAVTFLALALASAFTHGLIISGIAPWVAAGLLVWLVTTLAAVSLPELFARHESGVR